MVRLTAQHLVATWLPEHGMVCASLTHHGHELLGQRGGLDAYVARGSAFGIPLLAPWANRLDGMKYGDVELDPADVRQDENGLPKDGAMANREWTVAESTMHHLVATFDADAAVLAVFPFPHRLTVDVRLDPTTLTVATTLEANGDKPVPVAFGWHPLFTLPDVPPEQFEVTVPSVREAVLDTRGLPTGETTEPAFDDGALLDRTADAEYPEIDGGFVLRGGGRELHVDFGAPDYPVGHLWAPPGETFVAWEPMTAPTNALVTGDGLRHVAPGDAFTATFSVSVR